MKTLFVIILVLVLIIIGIFIGLQVPPHSFVMESSQHEGVIDTVQLPEGLPQPVEKFYQLVYGDSIPVIESAVISGSATMRLPSKGGIKFPGRFIFVHDVGKDYRHYIEVTLFGLPIMKVNEYFLDGKSRMELPVGVSEGAKVDQGANLALWAEAIWFPSVWLTDPQVHWEPIDENSAHLFVPFEDDEERILVTFNPETGLIDEMQSMRYKEADSEKKTKWINQPQSWQMIDGYYFPLIGAITWEDEGSPWAVFTVEDILYNTDVQDALISDQPGSIEE